MTAPQLSQDIINLYDEYTHAPLERRVFIERLTALTGSTAAAYALLPVLQNNYAHAQMVAEDDERLQTEEVEVKISDGQMLAYIARPVDGNGNLPAIVVIHENRGLNPHIRYVARRAALDGYVTVAPDFLSADGTPTPPDEDQAREQIGQLDAQQTLERALAMVEYARSGREGVSGQVGTVGFCWGGGLVNQLAVHDQDLNAAVSFYGRQAGAEQAVSIANADAGSDDRINAGINDYVAALQQAEVSFGMHLYEGVNHAFHNDTNTARYDEAAARLAWSRTMAFFAEHL